MVETSSIYSSYFKKRFAIHGHNVHLPASQRNKIKWFVYSVEYKLIYVGGTTNICRRWANTKKACLDCDSVNTGLYKHFKNGCPGGNEGGELEQLRWTIIDFMETTNEKLTVAGHQAGPKYRCSECQKLNTIEEKWICRLGSFYGENGLKSNQEPELIVLARNM